MERDDEVVEERERRRGSSVGRYVGWAVAGLLLIVVGAWAGAVWSERRAAMGGGAKTAVSRMGVDTNTGGASTAAGSMPGRPGMASPDKADPPTSARGEETVEVTLTPEAIERAGIRTADVRSEAALSGMTVPGTVMSNAYRDTKVNALVGGIVRQVSVELGSAVELGQPLAVILSAELAEAQMKYLSMRAMLRADRQKHLRTEKLVELGAASRQELEDITAIHAAHETELAAARQRLLLLGLSDDRVAKLEGASDVVSEVTVPSPMTGIVIGRSVNAGQVVSAGMDLFVVTDLSSVWVIGDLYEKDFALVRVGSSATISIPAVPQRSLRGQVAYIDPRVDLATRTAKVRVEVPNRDGQLRLGMFVTLSFQTGLSQRVTLVPRAAIQTVGERAVVYTPADGEDGKFTERTVKLGAPVGEFVQVLDGLKPGEKVVTNGSFFLRAEATRTRSGG